MILTAEVLSNLSQSDQLKMNVLKFWIWYIPPQASAKFVISEAFDYNFI